MTKQEIQNMVKEMDNITLLTAYATNCNMLGVSDKIKMIEEEILCRMGATPKDWINKVHKIVHDHKTGTIAFIIQTDGDQDFWYWYLNEDTVHKYMYRRGFNLTTLEQLTQEQAEMFCNDIDNTDKGVSVAGFDTIDEALKDLSR